MSELYRTNPYYDEHPSEEEFDVGSEIPSSGYLHHKQREKLAEYYTGDKDSYLSYAEEAMLAGLIQDGIKAQDDIAQIETLPEFGPDDTEQLKAAYERVESGRHAKRVLVEANMRVAAYFARASVGIVNPESTTKARSSTSDRYRGKNKKPRRIGTYADIRDLRSPHAQLEDRTQVAYMGLLTAADKFKPSKVTQNGEGQVAFATFAAWHIQAAIDKFTPYEQPGWRLPEHVLDNIKKYHDNKDDLDDPILVSHLERTIQGRETVHIDDLAFAAAPEEADEYGEGGELAVAELIHDNSAYVEEKVIHNDLSQNFVEIFDSLGDDEREAGIIEHRYGFKDGSSYTLDEIGKVYSITRERVRQLESKAMSKIRHPSRSDRISNYTEPDELPSSMYYSGDNIRTPHQPISLAANIASFAIKDTVELESWQATPEDVWDAPVRSGIIGNEEEEFIEYEIVESGFEELLLNVNVYHFQKSFEQSIGKEYPTALLEQVNEIFGSNLKPEHIEKFWNTHLATLIERIQQSTGEDISYDRFGQFFAALLRDRMTEDDTITLDIPSSVDGKLNYMGAWQQYGTLTINGNVGDYAAHKAGALADITINGSAGVAVGAQTTGYASIRVTGSAGDMAGFEASGNSTLVIEGNAGDFVGACAKKAATIVVDGNAGNYAAREINNHQTTVQIGGDAGLFFADRSKKGFISLAGNAASITNHSDFSGQLVVGGKLVSK